MCNIYKAKANSPARMAAVLTKLWEAAPVKVGRGGLVGVEFELPTFAESVELWDSDTSSKLAQVNRVVLAVWTTIERLPKKLAGP